MHMTTRLGLVLALVAVAAVADRLRPGPEPRADALDRIASRSLARRPTCFVPNLGQWEGPFRYRADFGAMGVFLEDSGWTLDLRGRDEGTGAAVRMRFAGGEARPELMPEQRLPGHHDYFLGSDPDRWRTEVPLFDSVTYRRVYAGVDVRMYEKDGCLEYDLVLQPGADLAQVEIAVEGAQSLRIDERGDLAIETAAGALAQRAPVTWQTSHDGERRQLVCRYVLRGAHRFGFHVDGWDRDLALTVDPGLTWSTRIGADEVKAVSVGESGIVTVAGNTTSLRFPTTPGAYARTRTGYADVFVSSFDPRQSGSAQLVYSTYLGGSYAQYAEDLFVDLNGVITIVGNTQSHDFPTTPGAYLRTFSGSLDDDGFVARLDPAQTGSAQLTYSTYLGSASHENLYSVHAAATGLITVVGLTDGGSWPTTPNAYDSSYNGHYSDAIVAQLDPSQTGAAQLVYSTFLGGSDYDSAYRVSADLGGVLTVVGFAGSGFPTTPGAYSRTNNSEDAFVVRLEPGLAGSSQLRYSTFLGGEGTEYAVDATVDSKGRITIGGRTTSRQFPATPGAFQPGFLGGMFGWDGFVAQIAPNGTGSADLVYATYFGSWNDDVVTGVGVDAMGMITVSGATDGGIPTTPGAYSRSFNGYVYAALWKDGFVTRLDPSRTGVDQLVYSTYLGGASNEVALALGLDREGTAIVGGWTYSANFPTTPGAFGSSGDAFVTRLDMLPTGVTAYGTSSPGCTGPLPVTVTSWPQAGNAAFSIVCGNAPPNSTTGWLLLTTSPLGTPVSALGVGFWVNLTPPVFVVRATSNAMGVSEVSLPVPGNTSLWGKSLFAQFLWAGPTAPPPCPPLGLSASNALQITIQPWP